jgi:TetR/AcrR family transcriptional repressor of nem operon
MPKPSHREKILTEGLRVVQARGFGGASVRDIVEAAGVPQGSFTNHFASKEAFCLEILDLYFKDVRAMIQRTLRNDSLPPLKRLRAFVDAQSQVSQSDRLAKRMSHRQLQRRSERAQRSDQEAAH